VSASGETKLERRFWRFWLAGILLLALQIVLNVWLVTDASPLGISDHQAAGSAARVDAIQAGWASSGVMGLALFSMATDLLFIGVYSWGAFAGGRIFAAADGAYAARLGKVIMFATVGFCLTDYAETVSQVIQAATGRGVDMLAQIAASARPVKSILFLVTFFGLLTALGIRRIARRAA
jgi:hypothetical protein